MALVLPSLNLDPSKFRRTGVLQAMYMAPPTDLKNAKPFFGAVFLYYNDMIIHEPRLLQMYDDLLPRIDYALGQPPTAR